MSLSAPFGVSVQGLGTRHRAGDVGVNGRVQKTLAQLAENDATESRHVQGCGTQGDQRLGTGLSEVVAGCQRDPLSQHGECTACLLELGQRNAIFAERPSALPDGKG